MSDGNIPRAALGLIAALLAGCTDRPPEYEGKMESAALLADGRVAVGYSQRTTRRPTGLAAFPDGGTAQILHDQFLVALVETDGRTHEIARYDNEAIAGSGAVRVDWFEADPHHLYITRSGQLSTGLGTPRLNETIRIDLEGEEVGRFSTARELAAHGRKFGAKGFGTQVVDAQGTMLIGATRDVTREMWRRNADGSWTLLDRFDGDVKIVGDDVVYQLGSYLFARNWRSGDMRKLIYFNRSTQQSEVLAHGDPALVSRAIYQPTLMARPGRSEHEIHVMRDNERIALIKPDHSVLDRR